MRRSPPEISGRSNARANSMVSAFSFQPRVPFQLESIQATGALSQDAIQGVVVLVLDYAFLKPKRLIEHDENAGAGANSSRIAGSTSSRGRERRIQWVGGDPQAYSGF